MEIKYSILDFIGFCYIPLFQNIVIEFNRSNNEVYKFKQRYYEL